MGGFLRRGASSYEGGVFKRNLRRSLRSSTPPPPTPLRSTFIGGISGQRAPNPPEFAQPGLSRSNGGDPQREGTNLGVFVPNWLVLAQREATNLGALKALTS